jgi:putative NADH-flavin reductase
MSPEKSSGVQSPAGPRPRVLVIGAFGGIGRKALETALGTGCHVTAVLRNPERLTLRHPELEIVEGDILEPGKFKNHLKEKDTVISAIGVKGGLFGDKPTTLYSQGNHKLLQVMKETGTKRAFFISASAVEISPVLPFYARLAARYILQKLLKHMYADLRAMETLIKTSDADWTIIRPPRLTDGPATGRYRYSVNSFLPDSLSISRADVAHFMIHHIADHATYKSMIELGY